jgi:hypothetical protein
MFRRSTPWGIALIACSTEAFSGNCGSGVLDCSFGGALSSASDGVLSAAAGGGGGASGGTASVVSAGDSAGGVVGVHAADKPRPRTRNGMRDTLMR